MNALEVAKKDSPLGCLVVSRGLVLIKTNIHEDGEKITSTDFFAIKSGLFFNDLYHDAAVLSFDIVFGAISVGRW